MVDFSLLFITLLFIDFLQYNYNYIFCNYYQTLKVLYEPSQSLLAMVYAFQVKSSQGNQTVLAHNFTEAAGFSVY